MTTFKPMLAVNSKPEDVTKPSYGSIKYEGVRLEAHPERGITARSLKMFANSELYNVPRLRMLADFCAEHDMVIEGELYIHGTPFRTLQSITATDGDMRVHSMSLHVFDCYRTDQPNAPFSERYGWYKWAVEQLVNLGADGIYAVHQQALTDPVNEIPTMYGWAVDNGYEGFCIKAQDAAYKHGRSTLKQGIFTRIKPEKDYDCIVLDIIERENNLLESEINELGRKFKRQDKEAKAGAGIAQTAIVYTPEFNRVHKVSLTRNIKDEDKTVHSESRRWLWENRQQVIGRCMRFVAIPVPGNDVPRSPRFDVWRDDLEPLFLTHSESDCIFATFDQSVADAWCDAAQGCETLDGFTEFYNRWLDDAQLGI